MMDTLDIEGMTVLVIEDHPLVREAICEFLRDQRLRILATANGREGIELTARYLPDLVLSNYRLPDADGLEVLQRIRVNERTKDIPVILLSGDPNAGLETRCKEEGAVAFVDKNEHIQNLLSLVPDLLRKEKQRREANLIHR